MILASYFFNLELKCEVIQINTRDFYQAPKVHARQAW